jgi:hypothetical protein
MVKTEFIVLRKLDSNEKAQLDDLENDYIAIKQVLNHLDYRREMVFKSIFDKENIQVGEVVRIKDGFIFKKEEV